jgi:GH15 family glucan-1,4-alpha-glucosidase
MSQPLREAGRTDREFRPLADYALLSDGRSCALVAIDGSVGWWAVPTMDRSPVIASILDPSRGGRLLLRPVGEFTSSRWYVGGGGVLVTEFTTADGIARVTDGLTLKMGSLLAWIEFARKVEAIEGTVRFEWEICPAIGFTKAVPWARRVDGARVLAAGRTQLALVLSCRGDDELIDGGFRGHFEVAADDPPALLAIVATDAEPTPVPDPESVLDRLVHTVEHWQGWADEVHHESPWRSAVVRAAIVLKQLTRSDTGAIQAAATTSLPEAVGGSRNFDYRFSWVRDTGFALNALTSLDLDAEVHAALSFLLRAISPTAPDIRVFYEMAGEEPAAEVRKVRGWRGYRDSSPVQVGNDAASQRQLGVYGDLMEAIGHYVRRGNVLDSTTSQVVVAVADQVCRQWHEPDAGLWELGATRHYTSSKLGCWAALDRAVLLADRRQVPADQAPRWRATAEQIRSYIDDVCWSRAKQAYTFYAGTDDLDCATLLAARIGYCAGGDPRLESTIEAIRSELSAGGPLLYRYSGMQDEEGAFVACSFWLVEALVTVGRLDEARRLMTDALGYANDLGLLSEEIDPASGALLGNFPQALSHLAVIGAATSYQRAVSRG